MSGGCVVNSVMTATGTMTASATSVAVKTEMPAILYPLGSDPGRVIVLPCDNQEGGIEIMRKMGGHMKPEVRWNYVGVVEEKHQGEWRQVLFDSQEFTWTQANAWRKLGFGRKTGERGVKAVPVTSPRVFIERIYGSGPYEAEGWVGGLPFYFRLEGHEFTFSVARDPQTDPRWVSSGGVDGFHTVQPHFGLKATVLGNNVSSDHREGKKCPCIWCKLAAAADVVRVCCRAYLAE
jgi:hypothetical protein